MKRPRREKVKGQAWRLRFGLLCVGLTGPYLNAVLVAPDQAVIYDSRDNQEFKRRFFPALLRVPLEIENCQAEYVGYPPCES